MNPFVVPVSRLLRHTGSTQEVGFAATFDPDGSLAATSPGAAEVVPGADVEVRLVLRSFLGGCDRHRDDRRPVAGGLPQVRDLDPRVLDVLVAEQFRRGAQPDDEDAYPLDDEQVDLFDLVRDAVVLELPLAPLCRKDCAGLCAACGADRNSDPCGCQPETDPRWATLDALRVPDQA